MAETVQSPPLPSALPVVALRGAVVRWGAGAGTRARPTDRAVLPLLQKNDVDEPTPDDVYRVGTVAIIRQMAKAPTGMRVLVEGVARARAEFLQTERGYMSALVRPLPEPSERSIEIDARG